MLSARLDIPDTMSFAAMEMEEPDSSVRKYLLSGLATVVVLIAGIGGWAATTRLGGAVLAPGTVVVESSVKKVQHPTGGIIGEIRVKEGDRIEANDILVRLDETATRANLQMITNLLDELIVRQTRLEAERDDATGFSMPEDLGARQSDPRVQSNFATEEVIFAARRNTCESQKSQYKEQIEQLRNQITGMQDQTSAKEKEIVFIAAELDDLIGLEKKQLVPKTRLVSLRREEVRLRGEHGQLVASAAQARGKIAETELQSLGHLQDRKSEVVKELREVQSKRAELTERKITADDQLRRVDLRAPQSGIVHQLSVHTVGGVIEAGEQIMTIVPQGEQLVVEAKVAPRDIDQVRVDHTVNIRFPAFDMRTTPEFEGRVSRISADLTRDDATAPSYYVARIVLNQEKLRSTQGLKLVPGMPAEVQIATADRTAMSYLMKPIEDQVARAFKER